MKNSYNFYLIKFKTLFSMNQINLFSVIIFTIIMNLIIRLCVFNDHNKKKSVKYEKYD